MKLQRKKSTPDQEQKFKTMLDSVEADLSQTLNRLRQEHADDPTFDRWGLTVGVLNHLRRAAVATGEFDFVKLIRPALAYGFLRLCGDDRVEALDGLQAALAQMEDRPLPAPNAPSSDNVQ